MGLLEQGGLAHNLNQAPESNNWIQDSRYLRYRKYHFALKAHLNLLPIAAQKQKYTGREGDVRCRECMGNVETQEHCLNVCQGNMPAMRARHNKVVVTGYIHPRRSWMKVPGPDLIWLLRPWNARCGGLEEREKERLPCGCHLSLRNR